MRAAGKRALGGGVAGAAAMGLQVLSLMWLRTTMNYQYRYGTTTTAALKHLWKEGGVPRFYRGLLPALAQGPLARFGDTAANVGVLSLLNTLDTTKGMDTSAKTVAASTAAAAWRIILMPIDATKTTMQVEGKGGFGKLAKKVRNKGPTVLYHGAMGAFAATWVGHFPWFYTYNFLDANLPNYGSDETLKKLGRSAVMGFCASVVSDCTSNSLRVLKVYKQSHTTGTTYPQAIREIIKADGLVGLFGRGLRTRILANGLQGMMFSVLWRYFDNMFLSAKKKD